MLTLRFQLEKELGLSLDGVYSVKVLDQYEYCCHCSFKDENGLHLVMKHEFNLVSNDTKRFLLLVEIFLTGFGWDNLYYMSESELKEKVFEAHLYAGGEAHFCNPAKPAIDGIRDYMKYLDREESQDFYEILDFLHGQLLTEEQEQELFGGQHYSDSNSYEAFESSLNGIEY